MNEEQKETMEREFYAGEWFLFVDPTIFNQIYFAGFNAGLESAQPKSICPGCSNHNDGYCNKMEAAIGMLNLKTGQCAAFVSVAFDEKEQAK